MKIWTILFGIGAVSFLVAGDWIILGGNWAGTNIFHLSSPSMPVPTERFWLSLTTSLMVTITVLSYTIQKDVRANLKLTNLLLVSKLTSTVVFLSAYFSDAPYFNYLLGSVFCDGPIFVITLIFYRRILKSLSTLKRGKS